MLDIAMGDFRRLFAQIRLRLPECDPFALPDQPRKSAVYETVPPQLDGMFMIERSFQFHSIADGTFTVWLLCGGELTSAFNGGLDECFAYARRHFNCECELAEYLAAYAVDGLPLPFRAHKCLRELGVETLADLGRVSDVEITRLPNCSRGTLAVIRRVEAAVIAEYRAKRGALEAA